MDFTVYIADEEAKVSVFRLSSDPRRAMKPGDSGQAFVRGKVRNLVPIAELELDSSVETSPVFANGVLYIATKNQLYTIIADKEDKNAGPESDGRDNLRSDPAANRRRNDPEGSRVPKSAFVPAPHDVVERMLDLAGLKKGEVVCDLGSGDGRILIMAAKNYDARAIGFEIDDELVKQSRKDAKAAGVASRVTVYNDDLFNADLSEVDVLTLYLYPVQNHKLLPQLQKLADGVRIVTHQYQLAGIRAEATQQFESTHSGETHMIYRYTTPLVADNPQD